ncbi:hypothetical protein [Erythrobacter crassostreae]|uniref:Uncharacterized protein n=1 Tax=Erythrobacter crassostreae TaxID=2828328 RepID=A0A9X1F4P5_9SPHN|nr:hypothetical protein [Erythrobacter crassostrea]MBV7259453.1 hypothetical protein [Erythrobacter crassostrea]
MTSSKLIPSVALIAAISASLAGSPAAAEQTGEMTTSNEAASLAEMTDAAPVYSGIAAMALPQKDVAAEKSGPVSPTVPFGAANEVNSFTLSELNAVSSPRNPVLATALGSAENDQAFGLSTIQPSFDNSEVLKIEIGQSAVLAGKTASQSGGVEFEQTYISSEPIGSDRILKEERDVTARTTAVTIRL